MSTKVACIVAVVIHFVMCFNGCVPIDSSRARIKRANELRYRLAQLPAYVLHHETTIYVPDRDKYFFGEPGGVPHYTYDLSTRQFHEVQLLSTSEASKKSSTTDSNTKTGPAKELP